MCTLDTATFIDQVLEDRESLLTSTCITYVRCNISVLIAHIRPPKTIIQSMYLLWNAHVGIPEYLSLSLSYTHTHNSAPSLSSLSLSLSHVCVCVCFGFTFVLEHHRQLPSLFLFLFFCLHTKNEEPSRRRSRSRSKISRRQRREARSEDQDALSPGFSPCAGFCSLDLVFSSTEPLQIGIWHPCLQGNICFTISLSLVFFCTFCFFQGLPVYCGLWRFWSFICLQLHIPDLRVGTLDSLLALSDDLVKVRNNVA